MLRSISFLCMALAFISGSAPATADPFTPAPGPTELTLSSDSASGKTAAWRFDADGVNAIRTGITVTKLGYDPYKLPSITITISGHGHKTVLKLASANFRPPLTVRAERWVGDTFLSQAPFAKPLALKQRLDVAIDWSRNGKVTIVAGGESHTLILGGEVEEIVFAVETGEVRFDPLAIGSTWRPDTPVDHYKMF